MTAVNPQPTIAGLKCSHELCLLETAADWAAALPELLAELARRRVNLPLVLDLPCKEAAGRVALCLEPAAAEEAWDLARRAAEAHDLGAPRLTRQVALVQFFPLSQDLGLPAAALASLAGAGLIPLGLATSLSAVVLVVRQEHLAATLDTLARDFDLPEGLSPPAARMAVVQSPRTREED